MSTLRQWQVGPYTLQETVSPFEYQGWLTSDPSRKLIMNARKWQMYFEQVCADHLAEHKERKFLDTTG